MRGIKLLLNTLGRPPASKTLAKKNEEKPFNHIFNDGDSSESDSEHTVSRDCNKTLGTATNTAHAFHERVGTSELSENAPLPSEMPPTEQFAALSTQPNQQSKPSESITGAFYPQEQLVGKTFTHQPFETPSHAENLVSTTATDNTSVVNDLSISTENNAPNFTSTAPPPPMSLTLVLRMRNLQGDLNDIRFEFLIGKDTSEGIASELVSAGLIDGRDIVVIAANLQKVIDNYRELKTVTFPLSSSYDSNEIPDDKSLIGFAQISVSQ